ncbi:Scr1 family TA system antitoxin-like transcriptional regulator [Streptomyces halstedii]|uniref:helix-turn-helix domain-containing protein n=1 Tax=Streptomyces halstedii TaxID=1944 RepID=UPI0037D21DAA
MAVPAPKKLDPTQSLTALYGSMLRKFRTKAGWTQRELGDRIPIAHSRIAQFELGNETPVPDVAQALDRLLKADGDLLDLWQHVVRTPIPDWARRYVNLEPQASKIRKYQAQTVPGLLQTEGYARALLGGSRPSVGAALERLVTARLARQTILGAEGAPVLWAILDEAVLWRPLGTSGDMREQLEHLIAASDLNSVVLQVLELDQGEHPLLGGSTTVLSFFSQPDMAYVESAYSGELVEHPGTVAEFALALDHLQALALSPQASVDLIRSIIEEKYCDSRLPSRARRRRLAQVQLQQRAGRRLRRGR